MFLRTSIAALLFTSGQTTAAPVKLSYQEQLASAFPSIDTGVFRGQRNLQDASSYNPIRIRFDTRLLEQRIGENSQRDADIALIKDQILSESADTWAQYLSVLPVTTGLSVDPSATCNGPNDMPNRLTEISSFEDADLVLIVDGSNEGCGRGDESTTLAYARSCSLETGSDRPVIGFLNFCLENDVAGGHQTTAEYADQLGAWTQATFRDSHFRSAKRKLLETSLHEIAHVLGQSSFLFMFFRDEYGQPRHPRDYFGLPTKVSRQCADGSTVDDHEPSEDIVKTVSGEQYLATPAVAAVVRNHFGCQELAGGRLHAPTNGGCIGSHWHERYYPEDLMGPFSGGGAKDSILSPITLALLDDSGWYKIDYSKADPSPFGIGAGCGFVEDACIKGDNEVGDSVQNEFCTTLFGQYSDLSLTDTVLDNVYCDPSHRSWALCDLGSLLSKPDISYFSDPNWAPFTFSAADACPMPIVAVGLDCGVEDADYQSLYPGESTGESSRCLNAFSESGFGRVNRPACMKITCDEEAGVVRVSQGDDELVCVEDGQVLTVEGGASIVCPRLAAVCPALFACPSACSGRGKCVYPEEENELARCECFDEANVDPACSPSGAAAAPGTRAPTTSPTVAPAAAAVPTEAPVVILDAATPPMGSPTPVSSTTSAPVVRPIFSAFSKAPAGSPVAAVLTIAPSVVLDAASPPPTGVPTSAAVTTDAPVLTIAPSMVLDAASTGVPTVNTDAPVVSVATNNTATTTPTSAPVASIVEVAVSLAPAAADPAPTSSPAAATVVTDAPVSVEPTSSPTANTTISPSAAPTAANATGAPTSAFPTIAPTTAPTKNPTTAPTTSPTTAPSPEPTPLPSRQPTLSPSFSPSVSPSETPSASPTKRRLKQTVDAGIADDNGLTSVGASLRAGWVAVASIIVAATMVV